MIGATQPLSRECAQTPLLQVERRPGPMLLQLSAQISFQIHICRFYDKAHKLAALDFFKRFAIHPDELPDTIFASVGRTVWRDVGGTALSLRFLAKVRRHCSELSAILTSVLSLVMHRACT